MKKASIVTLIVSAAIIIVGAIVCAIGYSSAQKEGYMLFPQTENGESIYTFDFTDRDINRITVEATTKTKITLSRGGPRSYIEIKNFNANYYRLNEENHSISFAEIDDVLSMFKFWEGFSFKGIRYVFASGSDRNEAHEITINLADEEQIESIKLQPKAGNITVDGFEGDCSLSLSVGEGTIDVTSVHITGSFVAEAKAAESEGSVKIDDLSASTVNVTSENAAVTAKYVKCERFSWSGSNRTFTGTNIEADELKATSTVDASVTLTGAKFKNATIDTQSGPVRVDLDDPLSSFASDLATQTGDIFINGEKHNGTSYKVIPEQLLNGDGSDAETDDSGENDDDAQDAQDGGEPADTDVPADGQDKQKTISYTSLHIHTVSSNIELYTAPEPEEVPADTDEGSDNG